MDEILLLAVAFSETTFEEIKRILQNEKYHFQLMNVAGIGTFQEAVSNHSPDIILLNSTNPTVKPREVINHIKGKEEYREIPIILAIDHNHEDLFDEIPNHRVSDIIYLPFRHEELPNRINILFDKKYMINQIKEENKKLTQLSYVASKTSNSIAIITPEGKIEWVNNGFTEMYEYSFQEFKEKFENKLYNPKLNTNFKKALNKSIYDKNKVVYENHWFTKSGKEKWVQTTLTPIFDSATKEVSKIIAIETDITKLKKTEERLEEKNNNLLKITKRIETTNEILENQRIELENEKQRSEELLLNILPYATAQQLKRKGYSKLRSYKRVTVMFADFKSFTKLSEKLSDQDLIRELSYFFEQFDELITQHHIEKIKTMGDCYMCAGGLPLSNKSNPIDVTLASLKIQDFVEHREKERVKEGNARWHLRIGLHTGEVIAGVIGKKKFAYDIWGDTVNTASRMESASETGKVNISGDSYQYLKDFFDCTYRGKMAVKYKGQLDMYYVNRLKPEFSKDDKGIYPNKEFMKILSSY
jgi:PAS domain S-box-containing protein